MEILKSINLLNQLKGTAIITVTAVSLCGCLSNNNPPNNNIQDKNTENTIQIIKNNSDSEYCNLDEIDDGNIIISWNEENGDAKIKKYGTR